MEEKSELKNWNYCCERTGKHLTMGNLYLYEPDDNRTIPIFDPPAEVINKHPAFLFDKDKTRGNVHMLPADINFAELCANTICEKRTEINKYIKEYLSENNKYSRYKNKGISHKNLPTPGSILNETAYEQAKFLFSYLRIYGKPLIKNDPRSRTKYDLIFNRFFIDQNNQVNCILLRFQIKMFNGPEPNAIENYPDTPEDKGENEVYYNLNVDIHSDAETIAKAFLDFVADQEKKKAPQKEEES